MYETAYNYNVEGGKNKGSLNKIASSRIRPSKNPIPQSLK